MANLSPRNTFCPGNRSSKPSGKYTPSVFRPGNGSPISYRRTIPNTHHPGTRYLDTNHLGSRSPNTHEKLNGQDRQTVNLAPSHRPPNDRGQTRTCVNTSSPSGSHAGTFGHILATVGYTPGTAMKGSWNFCEPNRRPAQTMPNHKKRYSTNRIVAISKILSHQQRSSKSQHTEV